MNRAKSFLTAVCLLGVFSPVLSYGDCSTGGCSDGGFVETKGIILPVVVVTAVIGVGVLYLIKKPKNNLSNYNYSDEPLEDSRAALALASINVEGDEGVALKFTYSY